jgi:poly(beta-D-mannuronate) lyase
MLRIIFSFLIAAGSFSAGARTIPVANAAALKNANNAALPGDTIVLMDGEWKNINIVLNCRGTSAAPVLVKAQTPGKVLITGYSTLRIGGSYIIVDGFYFINGFSGNDAAITFRSSKTEVANNCRVTNTVINDFNNPKRSDENYWVALYGKNNRVDNCSFLNKKNIGVLMAVILDDERSRENFHSISHNYFGVRLPLASNGGEIIRVGVSEHCQFNSNTQITDNFFEHCDGETEIISIKSCSNLIRNNVFKECQGSVVLRHGNYNTVESNVFLGTDKKGTGGVRIINKGQWVVNNFFYRCRGEGFRSPLAIMNGVPNSPANRYLEVSEAVVCNNSFYDCTPMGFCVGSDTERSVAPYNVLFLNNIFFNRTDSLLYHAYDNISGISFFGNLVSNTISQQLTSGFIKTGISQPPEKGGLTYTGARIVTPIPDSLIQLGSGRLSVPFSARPGLNTPGIMSKMIPASITDCGAKWFSQLKKKQPEKVMTVNCKTASEVLQQLKASNKNKLTINLTGANYTFTSPINISNNVTITTAQKQPIQFSSTAANTGFLVQVKAGGKLTLTNLSLDLAAVAAATIITADTAGSSNHYNFSMKNCRIANYNSNFFMAPKSSVADSIIVDNCSFRNGKGDIFKLMEETDKKGYYNVEQLKITNSTFTNNEGQLLSLLRSGNDESTMGPLLVFRNNKLNYCSTDKKKALLYLYGVQASLVENNSFYHCNRDKAVLQYEDMVRAVHILRKNVLENSGVIVTNKFVQVYY